ncbi:MAG: ATP-binding protein, partial [Paracoccaceae bacterium]
MDVSSLEDSINQAQVDAFHANLPGIIIAPTMGALFTAFVLYSAVNTTYLLIGLAMVSVVSALRVGAFFKYRSESEQGRQHFRWRFFAVAGSLLSGMVWGSAAFFIYPPENPEYNRFLIILLSLTPIAPVAALASYPPTFYAYYFPASLPFVLRLIEEDDREAWSAAVLLTILMIATVTFARKFHESQNEAHRLRLTTNRQKAEIETLLSEKRQFMLDAGHEMRQPVQALDLLLHSLKRDAPNDKARRTLDAMNGAVENISQNLHRLQVVAGLEVKATVNKEWVSLDGLLSRLHQEFLPLAEAKKLRFLQFHTTWLVHADKDLLQSIFSNLIANSVSYTEAGGLIIGVRQDGAGVRFQISDTGPGISDSDQKLVFNDFVRLDRSTKMHPDGLGLGLSIVRRSAELLSATIAVKSVMGKGTT